MIYSGFDSVGVSEDFGVELSSVPDELCFRRFKSGCKVISHETSIVKYSTPLPKYDSNASISRELN